MEAVSFAGLLAECHFRKDAFIHFHVSVVQPRGKDAKPYRVRQLREMIEEFDLKL